MKIIIIILIQLAINGLLISQLPIDKLEFINTDILMSNTLCEQNEMGEDICIIFRNRPSVHPLNIQQLHNENYYSAEAYMGEINDVQGTIVQKLDINTGEVSWQKSFNFSTYDSLHKEKPVGLYVSDDRLILLTFQDQKEYDPDGINIVPLQFYQFTTSPVNLVRRTLDANSGELLSENVIISDKFANGINGDSDFSREFIPVNADQFMVLNRTGPTGSLDLGFLQQGAQFEQEQVFPLGEFDSLTALGESLNATFKTYGFNFFISDKYIYHYEKVRFNENATEKRAVLLEIYSYTDQVESNEYSFILDIDEDDFRRVVIEYADDNHFIIQLVDTDDNNSYYLFQNDGTFLQTFSIIHEGQLVYDNVFSKSPTDNSIIAMGTSLTGDRENIVFTKITNADIEILRELEFKHEFYTFTPTNLELTKDLILISGQYSSFERDDQNRVLLGDQWISNFTIKNDLITSTQSIAESPVFEMSPNPITDDEMLSINYLPQTFKSSNFIVYNYYGSVVQTGNLSYGSNSISLVSLNSGVYFIAIYNNDEISTGRIIKI